MSKPAYQYNAAGIYTGATVADESPLEPGVYLLPAGCTLTPPPEAPAGQVPRWNGSVWQLIDAPVAPTAPDAMAKLQAFLAQNPDVQAMLAAAPVPPA